MATFQYTASDSTASIIRGSLEATDERAAVVRLRANGYYPIKVRHPGAPAETRPSLLRLPSRFSRALALGMKTLWEDGWRKLEQGVTALEDLLRVTKEEG